MKSNWQHLSLREAGISLIDCVHKTPKAKDDGYPYVAIPQIKDGRIDLSSTRKISHEDFLAWTIKAKPKAHDIVLSRRCNPGESAYVPEGVEFALGQNLVLLRSDGKKVYGPYLRWLLNSPFWWTEVQKYINVGAVFTSLKCADVPNFTLPIPPLNEQIKISEILYSIDKKIELNHQTNQTLEAMAQAIFKSWFVDFEPVKAKIAAIGAGEDAEGVTCAAMRAISGKTDDELDQLHAGQPEHYAHLKTTAKLFPAAMQDSELGEVPEGWEVMLFSKLAKLDTTSVKPYKEPDKLWEHYSIPAFDVNEAPNLELGSEIKSNKYKVNPFAILSSKLNPNTPRTWWPDVNDQTSAICSTEFMQFIPNDAIQRAFIFGLVTSDNFQSGIKQRVTGSTGSRQRAQPRAVAEMDIVNPKEELILAYCSCLTELSVLKAKHIKENIILTQLRDTLLPKLLSGEISVDVAKPAEEN